MKIGKKGWQYLPICGIIQKAEYSLIGRTSSGITERRWCILTLLEQCRRWNKEGQYSDVIEALEKAPRRSAEQTVELAWAYVNGTQEENDKQHRKAMLKAVKLLEPLRTVEKFRTGYLWNLTMGCALTGLRRDTQALPYLEEASDLADREPAVDALCTNCLQRISRPVFRKNYLQRAREVWQRFSSVEGELYAILLQDDGWNETTRVLETITEIFQGAMENATFSLRLENGKGVIRMHTEGNRARMQQGHILLQLVPQELLERWTFRIGRKNTLPAVTNLSNKSYTSDDVEVWVSNGPKNGLSIGLYSEALEQESPETRYAVLDQLVFGVLGELSYLEYGQKWKMLDSPKKQFPVSLTQLPCRLKAMGLDHPETVEELLEQVKVSHHTPTKMPTKLRDDVYYQETHCPELYQEYIQKRDYTVGGLYGDGALAGYFAVPLTEETAKACYQDETRRQEVVQKLWALGKAIAEKAGPAAVSVEGVAMGVCYGYVDMIAWDVDAMMDAATAVLGESTCPCGYWQTFRQDAYVVLVYGEEEKPEQIPGNPTDPSHMHVLVDWTDPDANGIPEEYTEEEMGAIEEHIERYFGKISRIFLDMEGGDVRADICEIAPTQKRHYYTYITVGMGARPQAQEGRAELVLALTADWQVDDASLENSFWSWPFRFLQTLTRVPKHTGGWLGVGHLVDNLDPLDRSTELCGLMLIPPQGTDPKAGMCVLPSGEVVNFCQVMPLYREELDYGAVHGVPALVQKMRNISYVVSRKRRNALKDT